MKRVQVIGSGPAEVKIYPLKRKQGGYRSYQIAWYEFGHRQTKTISDPNRAKVYAQEVHVSLIGTDRRTEITMRDVEIFRDAEALCAKFGVSLPFAIREWADAGTKVGGASLL